MSPTPRDAGVLVGVMALEDEGRVNFRRLREERRRRVFDGMDRHDLDALVLGRLADVHYVSGARQLWRAGASPFAPLCVVVRQTGRVHLMSVWDEGLPPEISHDDMYGVFWNPGNLLAALGAIPGLGESRRVGTDGLTPGLGRLLPTLFPLAELVDGGPVVNSARKVKTPDEIVCMTVAAAIAEASLSALEDALQPGISERALLGIYYECIARLGAPSPASESVAFATPNRGPVRFRFLASERPVGDGELVVLSPSALYAGYEAGLGRTRLAGRTPPSGTAELAERCWRAMDGLLGACQAGNTGADLYRAWEAAGEAPSAVVLAHGLGLGAEAPVIGLGRGMDAALVEGSVLSVQSWVTADGTGGCLARATVHIGPDGPDVLTRSERFEP
jgi:Xaa-Pro aminopeptidase